MWLIWLESFEYRWNYHCDENGLAGQFWRMESALRFPNRFLGLRNYGTGQKFGSGWPDWRTHWRPIYKRYPFFLSRLLKGNLKLSMNTAQIQLPIILVVGIKVGLPIILRVMGDKSARWCPPSSRGLYVLARLNRPSPSSKDSHFQNKAKCKTIVVKMSFICMGIN